MYRLMTTDEVAAVTGWKPSTIRQKVWRRQIPFIKLGRNVRFRQEAITKMIDDSEVPPEKDEKN